MKKIFISHSSNDRKYVEYLADLLECIGISADRIFCTSLEGYGIPLGENFLERIRLEFSEDTLVLCIISKNFYESPMCLCEMGAAWVKAGTYIPILIPPFDFNDLKGIISMTQGLRINDKNRLYSLCAAIGEFFGIESFDVNKWERIRDRFVSNVNREILEESKALSRSHKKNRIEERKEQDGREQEMMEVFDAMIKEVSDRLNKLPWIVRKGLYYHFAGRDFFIDPQDNGEESSYALKAAEDDYLIIDGKWITLNARDPKVRKAIESLDDLKYFLETAGKNFHDKFEERYEICAKIESRKFWRMMEIL